MDIGLPIDDTFLIGSFGALATLLFAAPSAPLGRLRNTFGGHMLSCAIAIAMRAPTMGDNTPVVPLSVQKVLVPAVAIATMKAARVVRRSQQPLSAQLQSTRRHLCAPWHMPHAHMCAHRVSRNTRPPRRPASSTPSCRRLGRATYSQCWLGARGSRPCSLGLRSPCPGRRGSANAYSGPLPLCSGTDLHGMGPLAPHRRSVPM